MPSKSFSFPPATIQNASSEERFVERRRQPNTFFLPIPGMEGQYRVTKLYLGDCHVAEDTQDLLETMLGACVAVCLRDPLTGIAGMCHYLLPACSSSRNPSVKQAGRYGASILPILLRQLEMKGARRNRMEAKIFGGATFTEEFISIGESNVACARAFLAEHEIRISGQDVGGEWPRHVQFRVKDGVVRSRKLKRISDFAIAHAEQAIAHALTRSSTK